jgi:predicted amidohydrolase YtcJ
LKADWVISGGAIETMEPAGRTADAVAISAGRILAVGSRDDMSHWVGPGTRTTDLGGSALLPAFTDTHMHLEKIAIELMMVHLGDARTIDELLAAVEATANSAPAGEWVQSFGDDNAWHERQLIERRLPTRHELDRVVIDQPVFLLRGPDVAVLNSLAVEELGSQVPALGGVELDAESGLLQGSDIRLLQGDLRSPEPWRQLEILEAACRRLLRFGITAVVDPGLPARFEESWNLYAEARAQGRLPLRVELMNRLDYRLPFDQEFARVRAEQIVPLAGDDFLRAFGAKMILDGEFSNAWVRPGEAESVVPEQRYTTADFDALLNFCAERGWPFCIHVMGGGAIDFVVERIGNAIAGGRYFFPFQISLAHVFLPSAQNLLDCRRLGIALSVQPLLAYVFEHEMLEAWGELAQGSNPYATMRASGLAPAGGSDVLPCEPLRGAQSAITRRSREGTVFGPSEALSPRAAIELFTSSAGPYMRRFDRGRIAPGFVADVVAWSANPLETDPDEWLTLEPAFVAVDGEVVYER